MPSYIVADRSTLTMFDSLIGDNPPAPLAFADVAHARPARLAEAISSTPHGAVKKLANGIGYVEAQIHGGIALGDISAVVGDIPPQLADSLRAAGIEVRPK